MNEKFYQLSLQKQKDIINSGIEYFARLGYKKASTEDIARNAGISKSLLFYYFKNKETYFIFLYNYAKQLVESKIKTIDLLEKNDFFDILQSVVESKSLLFNESPYLMDFLAKIRISDEKFIQDLIKVDSMNLSQRTITECMKNIDFTKFKEGINPEEIIEMLILLLDGYLSNKLKQNQKIILDELMTKYKGWIKVLKISAYKEEYLCE